MKTIVYKVAFLQGIELDIEVEEEPQMSNEEKDVFWIDDVISAFHDRDRDDDKPILEELKKLKGSDVDMVAVDKLNF